MDQTNSTRLDYNLQLAALIMVACTEFPDWRFHQLLQNLKITSRYSEDKFYEESSDTLGRVLQYNNISAEGISRIKNIADSIRTLQDN